MVNQSASPDRDGPDQLAERWESIEDDDGAKVIYDKEKETAWFKSDVYCNAQNRV